MFAVVVILQAVRLVNMYLSYLTEYRRTTDQCLLRTVELNLHRFSDEKDFDFCFHFNENDTLSIVGKKMITTDTTGFINKRDSFALSGETQCRIKIVELFNVVRVDSIFEQQLKQSFFPVKETRIDCIDLETQHIIESSALQSNTSGFYESNLLIVDMSKSIGIKAYVEISFFSILERMMFQLVLSVLFMIGVIYCLVGLLPKFFKQHKTEQVKSDFVHTMAHETNRFLTTAISRMADASENLEHGQFEEAFESIEKSRFQLDRLTLYTRKIQEIMRGENDMIQWDKTSVPLRSFFEEIKIKYEQIEYKIVIIKIETNGDLSLYTDKVHLNNVIDNLMDNAIKYSDDPVHVSIKAYRKKDHVVIHIRDDGWGIPDDAITCIFNKFYRVDSHAIHSQGGFGLGLSYVKTVIDALGGQVFVNSLKNEFTEFVLMIPSA